METCTVQSSMSRPYLRQVAGALVVHKQLVHARHLLRAKDVQPHQLRHQLDLRHS